MELLRTIAHAPKHYSTNNRDLSWERAAGTTFLKTIEEVEELSAYAADLEELAADLATQNVSYEPWTMLPIVRACS